MNAGSRPPGPYEADPTPYLGLLAMAGGMFISAPALVIGIALAPIARRATAAFAALAVAGAAWVWLLWARIGVEMQRAQRAGERHGMFMHPGDSLQAAWPHIRTWWLLAAPLCLVVALVIALFRPRSVEELRERDECRAERARERAERKARRAVGVPTRSERQQVFELGRHVTGDFLLPVKRGRVFMPLARLGRTLLVIGAPGAGKTVTLGRLAYGVAASSDWKVIVIDAKGDPATQAAFAASMRAAGRQVRLFPQEPYDAWRGSGREIANRLVQLIDWADEGGGTYYRDLSISLVRLACTAPGGPPRSSEELLRRLDKTQLMTLWAGHPRAGEIERFRDEHIDACRQRYRSFFDATAGQLDGAWAFEDADCAYILLNELLYAEETGKLARLLVEDFKQYLAGRNPDRRRVLLIVDEFSAIADGERMARMVEVVRSYGAAVVLAPQCLDGMGGPEASARILNAAHTIILHAVPDPEQIVKAAGTKMATEWSLQHERGLSTDVGSTRTQHQPISTDMLRGHAAEMQNIVQFSPPAPVAADSAEAALELVFDQLVLDAARKSFPFEKKHRAQGAARQAYKAHGVPAGAVRERAPVRSGVFDGTFDFAVHNGHTVQLVQCWSFQLPNQADLAEQVKAWSWLVHEVRKEGGELSTGDGAIEVPSELEIYAIAIPPVPGTESPAYEEAKAAFAENHVIELAPDEADRVGEQAAEALGATA